MKNKVFFLIVLMCAAMPVFAEGPVLQSSTTPPLIPAQPVQNTTTETKPVVSTNFENCVRTYKTSVDNLFYLTLAAINASNYKIDEIQSRTGYISFLAGNKSLLASITSVDSKNSMIKITPADNSYTFSPTVIDRIFVYLTNNVK